MFKKIVRVESSTKQLSKFGAEEWLITFSDKFYSFSRQPLEVGKIYKIVYYVGTSGVFRISEASEFSEIVNKIHYPTSQTIINQNILVMGDLHYSAKNKLLKT